MANKEYCSTMAFYNRWMNEKIYEACSHIPDEERKRDKRAFFKSIHSTLNHVLWADLAWIGRLAGHPFELPKYGEDLFDDFNTLRSERIKVDAAIIEWAHQLAETSLDQMITYESMSFKKTIRIPVRIAVMHMFNHQTHHRGQITTLLSQMGIDYGPTDLSMVEIALADKP